MGLRKLIQRVGRGGRLTSVFIVRNLRTSRFMAAEMTVRPKRMKMMEKSTYLQENPIRSRKVHR